MKFNLILILFLQMFMIFAETFEIGYQPREVCELKFEKDIFSLEERDLIKKDINRMFISIMKRKDIIKKNIFTGEYSFAKVPPLAFPKNFTKYFEFEEGQTTCVFILNSKGCDAYKKAFDFRYKHKEEIKKLEEFTRALHNSEFKKLSREEKEKIFFDDTSEMRDSSLDYLLHLEDFDYFLQPPLCMLTTRYVTYPDGNKYLTWFYGSISNEWGEFEANINAFIYRDGRWTQMSGNKTREFLIEEYKQWVLSGEE